ncbi:MAG: CinA family protein [Brevundimonas sp.]|uniref:CinA family protein n=1 Tax=Brevundimonas sp. TaxID=1871086 RepID=UPI00391C595E
MFPADIEPLAKTITDRAADAGIMLATAESCTAGLLVAALTTVSGSAKAVDRGFVTYSNDAKHQMLGVDMKLIDLHGAVSRSVAEAMAKGALKASGAGLAASVTGIAGPTGGTAEKPVGLVHFAVARQDGRLIHREERFGDIGRDSVRLESVRTALRMMAEMLA